MGFTNVHLYPSELSTDMETEVFLMESSIDPQRKNEQMHVYNKWLPQSMVEEVKEEPQRFHKLVVIMEEEMSCLDTPAARLATTKWIPVINTYVLLFLSLSYSVILLL